MRRAAALVLGTLTGGALLVGAKLGNSPTSTSADVSAGAVVVPPGDGDATGPQASATASRKPSASAKPTTSKSPLPTKTTTKPTPTPTPKPTSGVLKAGTYTASAQVVPPDGRNRGTLSMTVTISGGKISNIQASETDPSETNCWNNACPKLRSEALSAQSANINNVSGATGTSKAYKSSLQAILDKAKA